MDVSIHQRIFSSFVCNQCDGFYETDNRAVFYLSLQVNLLFESRFFVVPVESQMCPTCTEYVCVDRTVGLSSRRKKIQCATSFVLVSRGQCCLPSRLGALHIY